MVDEVVMGVLQDAEIRVVAAVATGVARTARDQHKARTAAAHVLAEGLVGSALLSALQLQKSGKRINLQLECDGPLRGIFVESEAGGALRGYAKNPFVEHEGNPGEYHWRPVYGNSGFLSVLRDQGDGEYFRSSVQLEDFDLPRDFERYFRVSDQVETALVIRVLPKGNEPLGTVAGILLQALPNGNIEALQALKQRLQAGALDEAVASLGSEVSARALISAVTKGHAVEVTSQYPIAWRCPCSKDRVVRALLTLGPAELTDMLEKEGKAEASCHFCSTEYRVDAEELKALIAQFPSVEK